MSKSVVPSWLQAPINGILLDITGVLYNSGEGDGIAIPGSIDAVNRLQNTDLALRFCSNESQHTTAFLVARLERLGFNIKHSQVFTPAPAVARILREKNLRPYLLTHPELKAEFAGISQDDPNCVVVGDAANFFTYDNMNQAFRVLLNSSNPCLLSMGKGKYYRETDGIKLDLGAYTSALEYACDCTAEVVGKPSPAYFGAAITDMGLTADKVVMVGDDIMSDILGAQKCGMRAIQVRTGKFQSRWEAHEYIKPDAICDDLATTVSQIVKL